VAARRLKGLGQITHGSCKITALPVIEYLVAGREQIKGGHQDVRGLNILLLIARIWQPTNLVEQVGGMR